MIKVLAVHGNVTFMSSYN